ncbi:NUDIX domain-containing protein [Haliea sp.]|jgi:ADP-ribose pyrophosphatase|uniref:NUDIX domain-containing protein n=1 Tax=Haliea TaxID=475794 RepID=UPI000C57C1E0|nr:NUDIX domain-containing protein [Haliea sp.]HBX72446.1 ADP-ribose diphosphatase [Halieaceae bacterium]MAD64759.1 ADP-ribose diphosphatase [Haliea sp.]MAY94265.1 ADP-ribose diphosphatase [Haliea sp.]MBP70959.1 ADP-ribose diphosphatase [Haliea sp.]HCD56702.1 ADP-ribose diphosphatase [Halieaceae bacterium]|tara:strand:+ start:33346 stop:33966 length:621 start_codon:yes stop_codon:yes gene_type:complete
MAFELAFSGAAARVLQSEAAFSGHFSVRRLTLQHRLFAGGWSEPLVREVFERGDAVAVLPYEPETDCVILIEQFRPGALRDAHSPWMLEVIAGVVEAGETDAEVAHREAAEEAACELAELLPIASYYPSAGACSEHVRLFCGRVTAADAGAVHGARDEGEDILVHRIPRGEALALLAADRVPNGHTLIALQWLQLQGESLRQRWLS